MRLVTLLTTALILFSASTFGADLPTLDDLLKNLQKAKLTYEITGDYSPPRLVAEASLDVNPYNPPPRLLGDVLRAVQPPPPPPMTAERQHGPVIRTFYYNWIPGVDGRRIYLETQVYADGTQISAIPEPGTIILLIVGAGVAGVVWMRKRLSAR